MEKRQKKHLMYYFKKIIQHTQNIVKINIYADIYLLSYVSCFVIVSGKNQN